MEDKFAKITILEEGELAEYDFEIRVRRKLIARIKPNGDFAAFGAKDIMTSILVLVAEVVHRIEAL